MRILIGVNTLQAIQWASYSSMVGLSHNLKRAYPDWEFGFFTPHRMSIDKMRNQTARVAMRGEFDYVWFIDDDMVIHPNTLDSLIKADKDIVMELTYIRGYPFDPMAFRQVYNKDGNLALTKYTDFEEHIDSNGLVEVYAVGCACTLIKTEIFLEMTPPHFVTGEAHTEDVFFCCKAKDECDASIFMDTKYPTGHLMDPIAVSHHNVKKLRELFKPEKEELPDRTLEYIEECLKKLNSI